MRVSILTLGCRVNQSESDIIEANLRGSGFSIVALSEIPDYCIINTCTVTAKSDYRSRQLIRRAARAGAKVIVTGCYAQLNPVAVKNIEGVVGVFTNKNKYNIINMLSDNKESYTLYYNRRSRPYLKIQDGCNFSCSYCAVPMARGNSKSLSPTEVIKHARQIESAGYNEVVLTGIHLGSYGNDLYPKTKLSDLLITMLKETKIPRIRLSSLEVTDLKDDLIELFSDQRICKHIHIPLQSGDDTILRLMNRLYISKDYLSTVDRIIKKLAGIAIGTDVIVGFPGEGDKEFKNTKIMLDFIPISYMHIFPFSPRSNTLAFKMAKQSCSAAKKERLSELMALNSKKKMAYMQSQMNSILDIVVEEEGNDNITIGTSSNYLKVKVLANGYRKGALIRVRATGIDGKYIKGNPIE